LENSCFFPLVIIIYNHVIISFKGERSITRWTEINSQRGVR